MFGTKFRKVISGTLVFAFTMGLFGISGCSRTEPEATATLAPGALVSAESVEKYYSVKSFFAQCDGDAGCWPTGIKPIYCDNDVLIIPEMFSIGMQDDAWGMDDENDDVNRVCMYSLKEENFGEVLASVDFKNLDLPQSNGSDGGDIIISGVTDVAWVKDAATGSDVLQYIISVSQYPPDYSSYTQFYRIYKVDIYTGDIIYTSEDLTIDVLNPDVGIITDVSVFNDMYYILSRPFTANGARFNLYTFDMNLKAIDTIHIDALTSEFISNINSLFFTSDNLIYIEGSDARDNTKRYIYNVEAGELTSVEFGSMWGDTLWSQNYRVSVDSFSISQVDTFTGEEITAVDFNHCNVNRNDINGGLTMLAVIDGKYLCNVLSQEHGYKYLVFEPGDIDPFSGKEAISLAVLDSVVSPEVNDAIYEFNCSNDSYYICVDNRYVLYDHAEIDTENNTTAYIYSDVYRDAMRDASSSLSNQMLIDIMAGNGPDIILGGYGFAQLNNSEVMVDLDSYIDKNLNRNDYFSAIFNNAGDGLYQLPYSVGVMAIIGEAETADYRNGDYGIAFDDYIRYIDNYCNGMNPLLLQDSRLSCFLKLFNVSRNEFISNGKISLNNDEFRSIVEYCNTLPDKVPGYDEYYDQMFSNGARAWINQDMGLYVGYHYLAYPTPNGAPPQLKCGGSVGITAGCSNPDAAWSFIELLLSDEIQSEVASIKKSIREQELHDQWDEWEEFCNNYYDEMDPTYVPSRLSQDYVMENMHVLENSKSIYTSDSDIDKILYEEIQAYFAGQKNLDQVIEIMENRCQTVLDERG